MAVDNYDWTRKVRTGSCEMGAVVIE